MVFVVAAALSSACTAKSEGAIHVYYAPEEHFQQVVDRCNAALGASGYRIVYNKLPRDADGQREQLVHRLAARDDSMDILGLDVTWTAEFARSGWIEEWTGAHKSEAEAGTLAAPLLTATAQGRLYAAPKNTDVQLLWYRDDLVPHPPATWDEMISMSRELQRANKPHTILITGAQYEGLVVVFNNLVAAAGGHILSDDGTKAEMDAGTVEALETLRAFASSGTADPSFSNSKEDDIRQAYEKEGAAFEINYAYVYPSMQENVPQLAAKTKWALLPSMRDGDGSHATLGGYNLAVSSYSVHKPEAFRAALCLRSAENQKLSAMKDGVPPTIESIYASGEIDEAFPMKQAILDALKTATVRPRTPAYQNVSTVLSAALSSPVSIHPQKTADALRKKLQDALDSKGVLP